MKTKKKFYKHMKRSQYDMFCKMISSLSKAKVGEYTFVILKRPNEVFQLDQQIGGITTTLKVGTHYECVEAAKDCIQMMYKISD